MRKSYHDGTREPLPTPLVLLDSGLHSFHRLSLESRAVTPIVDVTDVMPEMVFAFGQWRVGDGRNMVFWGVEPISRF